jgi:hypothetical protein
MSLENQLTPPRRSMSPLRAYLHPSAGPCVATSGEYSRMLTDGLELLLSSIDIHVRPKGWNRPTGSRLCRMSDSYPRSLSNRRSSSLATAR